MSPIAATHFQARSSARTTSLAALSLASLAFATQAQQLVRSVNGPAAGSLYGKAVVRIDDQDGDGIGDLLVGAPGFNANRGAVLCISGAYLATGSGPATLWIVAPPNQPGDLFGTSLAAVGDVTSDGVPDFLVGMPGYDHGTSADAGAVRLISGSTLTAVSLIYDVTASFAFGSAMAPCGDRDGDGKSEVAVGAPGPSPFFTELSVLKGSSLMNNVSQAAAELAGYGLIGSGDALGTSVATGFDLDGDGYQDIAVGAPGRDGPGATDAGECRVLSLEITVDINGNLQWTLRTLGHYASTIAGERLGQSIDAAHDYDGDGAIDVVVGAPNTPGANNTQPGRVVVLSGAELMAQTPPYELYMLAGSPGTIMPATFHFGAAVCASDDLNDDGVGDFLVGSPDYFTSIPIGPGKGAVSIYSGATGVRIGGLTGANNDRLGDTLAGAIDDYDNDGFDEFVVAGSLSDAGGTDSGVVKCYRLFPCSPSSYCTGKTNSLGCVPAVSYSGSPSASSGAPFLITASNLLNQKNGLLFYSHQPGSTAFQGGYLCAKPPTARTPPQFSGGSTSGSDCTGAYAFDFNAWITSAVDPTLVTGAEVFAQYWSRDPQSPSTTSLSNALRFLINP